MPSPLLQSSHRPSPRHADRLAAPKFFQSPLAPPVNEGQSCSAAPSSRRSVPLQRPVRRKCEAQSARSPRPPPRPLREGPNHLTKSPSPHNEADRRESSFAP